jgi:hypothetical protein
MEKKITSLMQMLLEGQEHERIKTELTQYANSIGYTKKVTFKNGMEPDVLYLNVAGDNLFMGDAKDSANETPSNSKTAERIYGYIETFGECLTAGQIKGGFIAILTVPPKTAPVSNGYFLTLTRPQDKLTLVR